MKIQRIMSVFLIAVMAFGNVTFAGEYYGDVDNDGVLTASDAAKVLQYVLNQSIVNADEVFLKKAGVLDNGSISAGDSAAILQKVLNNSYIFPVQGSETTTNGILGTQTTEVTTEVTTQTTTVITTEVTTEATTRTTTVITTESTTEATTVDNGIVVNEHCYYIGEAEAALPTATRVENGTDGYKWYIYADDYSKYIKAGVVDGVVKKLYTTAQGFDIKGYTDGMVYTDKVKSVSLGNGVSLTLYVDSLNENKLYAVALKDIGYYESTVFNSETIKASNNAIFDITNAYRVKNGLNAYKKYDLLDSIAQSYADYMAVNSHYDHADKNGNRVSTRLDSAGVNWMSCGENIAAGYVGAERVMDGWINSENHRKNILKEGFEYLGVGTAYNDEDTLGYKTRYVQNFCSVF